MTPEELAEFTHATYERLAPEHGYKTREASAVPWEHVPERNKSLMIAVCTEVLARLQAPAAPSSIDPDRIHQWEAIGHDVAGPCRVCGTPKADHPVWRG